MQKKLLVLTPILILIFLFILAPTTPNTITWQKLSSGAEYAIIDAPLKSTHGNSKIDILRFNPNLFSMNLMCSSEKKTGSKTLDLWCKESKALAGINAGMFQLSGKFDIYTGFMKNYNHINNPNLNGAYKNILAFNPKDSLLPAIKIIDLTCENWNDLKTKYNSLAQGIRMLDCNQKNTWVAQEKNGAWLP